MVVLLTGASGFLGRRLVDALLEAGHEVVCAVRRAPAEGARRRGVRYVEVDFTADFSTAVWLPRLAGVHAVINAVGILRESGRQRFDAIHVRAPQALFAASAAAGVRRVVQISALGADESASSRYHLSKRTADEYLLGLPVRAVIVQPSLVFGPGGASARLFTTLASLPAIPVPGDGSQRVQPVHVDDVAQAIVALLDSGAEVGGRVPLVGPEPLALRDFLVRLRGAMGLGRARVLPVPMPWVRLAARVGAFLPDALLDPETLQMLVRGNTASPGATQRLLGRPPRPVGEFVPAAEAADVRTAARLRWLLPPLKWSIALVWIVTGIVSLGVYPVAESYALLARVGATGPLATVLLHGAAALDLALGIAVFALRRRRALWLVQIAVILVYTLVITMWLPEYWIHPYGPVLKNLPMLAALWLLYELDEAS